MRRSYGTRVGALHPATPQAGAVTTRMPQRNISVLPRVTAGVDTQRFARMESPLRDVENLC
jgi:hypothetical protein